MEGGHIPLFPFDRSCVGSILIINNGIMFELQEISQFFYYRLILTISPEDNLSDFSFSFSISTIGARAVIIIFTNYNTKLVLLMGTIELFNKFGTFGLFDGI